MTPGAAKGPEAFRSISEASSEVGVPQHVLRFWETKFAFIRPMKRAGGRRFYRRQDLAVLRGVRALLQEEGYTIKGVQRLHKEGGLRRLVAAGGAAEEDAAAVADALSAEVAAAPGGEAPAPPLNAVVEPQPDTEDEEPADTQSGRPVLDLQARARLATVLRDLEGAKGAIDLLLRRDGDS